MIINNIIGGRKQELQKITLISMKNAQSGIVVAVKGGKGMINKLESLGIRLGVRITKKSAVIGGGPVIIGVGNTELAIGHGMASRILVEVDG